MNKNLIKEMRDEELTKTLEKEEESRDRLVLREQELIERVQKGDELAMEERKEIMEEFLGIIDTIDLIKKEQARRLTFGGK